MRVPVCLCGHSESDHLQWRHLPDICLIGECPCLLFRSSPAIARDAENVVIEVRVGERVLYRGTAWSLVLELVCLGDFLGGAFVVSDPIKVFANGVEQDEPLEDSF